MPALPSQLSRIRVRTTGSGQAGRPAGPASNGRMPAPGTARPLEDHRAAEIGRPAPLGIDAVPLADVRAQRGGQAGVLGQLVREMVGVSAAEDDQVDPLRQLAVAQGRELDELRAEVFQGLQRVGEIAAERLVGGVRDAEPPGFPAGAGGEPSRGGRGQGPALRQGAEQGEVGVAEEARGELFEGLGRRPVGRGVGQGGADGVAGPRRRPSTGRRKTAAAMRRIGSNSPGSSRPSRIRPSIPRTSLGRWKSDSDRQGTTATLGRSSASAIGPRLPGRSECRQSGAIGAHSNVPSTIARSASREPLSKTARQMSGGMSQASRWRPGTPLALRTVSLPVGQARARKCCTRHPRDASPPIIARLAIEGSDPSAGMAKASLGRIFMGGYRFACDMGGDARGGLTSGRALRPNLHNDRGQPPPVKGDCAPVERCFASLSPGSKAGQLSENPDPRKLSNSNSPPVAINKWASTFERRGGPSRCPRMTRSKCT